LKLAIVNATSAEVVFEVSGGDGIKGDATLTICDVLGRRAFKTAWNRRDSGAQRISWELRDTAGERAPIGVYFARLQVGDQSRQLTVRVLR